MRFGFAGEITLLSPSASAVILSTITTDRPIFTGVNEALKVPTSKLRIFGKPKAHPNRRMAVALAIGSTVEQARERAKACASAIVVQ